MFSQLIIHHVLCKRGTGALIYLRHQFTQYAIKTTARSFNMSPKPKLYTRDGRQNQRQRCHTSHWLIIAHVIEVIYNYTTIHTNEAIWLVLERAWLEYRSRLTSHNIKTRLFRYFNCIFLPFIDTFYEKYGRKQHEINTRLVRPKFRRFSTKRTVHVCQWEKQ